MGIRYHCWALALFILTKITLGFVEMLGLVPQSKLQVRKRSKLQKSD